MPLFDISGSRLLPVEQTNFFREKELQKLIEDNLQVVFNCRLVASEYSTGAHHAGRIDTLALSEEDNPVIIEYKKTESSELINQSLFYLHWIQDHRGDFEISVQKALGSGIQVDWSAVRVICMAPNYRKYDLHAVQVMRANIELWRYRLFANSSLHLEEVFHDQKSESIRTANEDVAATDAEGKKIELAAAEYTFEKHLAGKPEQIQDLMHSIREYVTGLDSTIEEVPKKFYVAYKASQNIVCVEARKKSVRLWLKLGEIADPPVTYRNVSEIGHIGTGNAEFTISDEMQFEEIKPHIEIAYNRLGG
jgi:predicted transport protein